MTPKYGGQKFQCPHCDTIASQQWVDANTVSTEGVSILNHLYLNYRGTVEEYSQRKVKEFLNKTELPFKVMLYKLVPEDFSVSICSACNVFAIWVGNKIVFPKKSGLPPPNPDLNEEIKSLYIEASSILADSPKGATALLRLALQKLLIQVGKAGKNINADIKELVGEGLSPKIQQALDLLRVIGNNSVHPGQINLDDNAEIAQKLFGVLNFIAEELISKPKELEQLYADLIPDDTKNHIKQRDGV